MKKVVSMFALAIVGFSSISHACLDLRFDRKSTEIKGGLSSLQKIAESNESMRDCVSKFTAITNDKAKVYRRERAKGYTGPSLYAYELTQVTSDDIAPIKFKIVYDISKHAYTCNTEPSNSTMKCM